MMATRIQTTPCRRALRAAPLVALLLCGAARAQFSMVPAPLCASPRESAQEVEQEFRIDASRHLYACYPMRVFRGQLPPLLYGCLLYTSRCV